MGESHFFVQFKLYEGTKRASDLLTECEAARLAVSLVVRGRRVQVEADGVGLEVGEVGALPPSLVLAHDLRHLVLVQLTLQLRLCQIVLFKS